MNGARPIELMAGADRTGFQSNYVFKLSVDGTPRCAHRIDGDIPSARDQELRSAGFPSDSLAPRSDIAFFVNPGSPEHAVFTAGLGELPEAAHNAPSNATRINHPELDTRPPSGGERLAERQIRPLTRWSARTHTETMRKGAVVVAGARRALIAAAVVAVLVTSCSPFQRRSRTARCSRLRI
jgi:hypothetical protein